MENQLRSIKELAVWFVFSGLFALVTVYALGDFGSMLVGMLYGAGAMLLAAVAVSFTQARNHAQPAPDQQPTAAKPTQSQSSTLASW